MKIRFYFLFLFLISALYASAQRDKHGAKSISSSVIVNEYVALTSDAVAGSTNLIVSNNTVNGNSRFTNNLITGDLIMIIQMQGVSVSSADDSTFGTITSYNNCGNYEFAQVTSLIGSNQINIDCGLTHSYNASGKTQIVRVPRYTTLTVNNGGTLTCDAWNGSIGGICVVECSGLINVLTGGKIDASAKGFRAGVLINNNANWGVTNYRWNVDAYGGQKGEGVAGTLADYDLIGGRYCKGSPANGGGGGNGHNAGGGGGSNAGDINNYNFGRGNPSLATASWANAWNLEYAGFASSTSSGGGKGGYTMSNDNQNALTTGIFNSLWGGDWRRDNGGRGGKPLDYSSGRIFMGGGGGAGNQNDNTGGSGGNGGGIVYLLTYNDIIGSGSFLSNGANGVGASSTDGSGGAGGGGTFIINTTGSAIGITINVKGGNGGSQSVSAFNDEAEGPGGGGGGGYISVSSGNPTKNVSGGLNGTTNCFSLSEFTPNGATAGGAGVDNGSIGNFSFSVNNVSICSGSQATLTVTTTGTVPIGTSFNWYNANAGGTLLGSGNTFTTPAISTNTTYWVQSCPGVYRIPVTVTTIAPVAAFNFVSGCQGQAVSFSDISVSSNSTINGWSWNFGDGIGTSTNQNPSYTYSSGTSFSVSLTIQDNFGCSSTTTQNINLNTSPNVNFSSVQTSGCGSLNVQFINNTSNGSTYNWSFGDGVFSTVTSPQHLYTASGNYTVILTANNGACSSADTIQQMITVFPVPSANFTSITACAGDTTFFTNTTNNNGATVSSWKWYFGDGDSSSTSNPYHIYNASGSYNVTLISNTNNGCSNSHSASINITPLPQISFSALNTSGCGSLNVNFSNGSTNATSYIWSFGDGTFSTSIVPQHLYNAAGNYTVILTANNGACSNADTIQQMISVYPVPAANFTAATSCQGDTTFFTNTTNNNGATITSWKWYFGDGDSSLALNPNHIYSTSGTYAVTLVSYTSDGCLATHTSTINITAGPQITFSASATSGCGSLNVIFTNNTLNGGSYTWSFGDGTFSSAVNPLHLYSNPGSYTVTLASSGTCSGIDSIVNYINVTSGPTAIIAANNACANSGINLQNNTINGNGSNWLWDFGNGDTSTALAPGYIYSTAGNYTITLIAGAGTSCADTTTTSVTIFALPSVNFIASQTHGCNQATVNFTDQSSPGIIYSWFFGDGDTSALQNPSHTFNGAGIYTVGLTVTDSNGCVYSRSKINLITIGTTPAISITASDTALCTNDCIAYNSTVNPSGSYTYNWNFAGANTNNSNQASPSGICYGTPGNFVSSLTVSDANCTTSVNLSSVIQVVTCTNLQATFMSNDSVICEGQCVSFFDLSTGATQWQWSFPGANTTSSLDQNPQNICYSTNGNYDVILIASDGVNTDTLTATALVSVLASPSTPVITQNVNTLTCSAALTYQWYFNGFLIGGATQQSFNVSISGNYYVVVSNAFGCSATSDTLNVIVTGIAEGENTALLIYPNPVSQQLFITGLDKNIAEVKLEICNSLGQIVFSENKISVEQQTVSLNGVKNLAAGFYSGIVISDKKVSRFTFFKE